MSLIRLGTLIILSIGLRAQDGPPPPAKHTADLERRIDVVKPVNLTAARALAYAKVYAARSDNLRRSGKVFAAECTSRAADALLHVAEHQQHLRDGGGPAGPPGSVDIREHLQRTYFKVQQADYFRSQSHDSGVAAFPKWSRDFYQLAVRASDRHDWLAADENSKCAEEVVKALENLAQAVSPSAVTGPPERGLP